VLLVTDNAAVPEKVQWRGLESVRLPPATPRLGRELLARTLIEAYREGVELRHVAALAWSRGAAVALSTTIGGLLAVEQGYDPDEMTLEDFDRDVITGTIGAACYDRNDDPREPITHSELDDLAEEYLAMVAKASELSDTPEDQKFLRQTRKRINAAISLIVRAPLFDRSIFEEWALVKAPDYSMLALIAEQYADYKRALDVADIADILATPVRPVEDCALALIDQAGIIPPLGYRTLRRLLPRASFVLNG